MKTEAANLSSLFQSNIGMIVLLNIFAYGVQPFQLLEPDCAFLRQIRFHRHVPD